MRLNMVKVKENFRSKYQDPQCRLCNRDKETTEHLLVCSAIPLDTIEGKYLKDIEDVSHWKKMIARMQYFIKKTNEIEAEIQQ